MTKIIKLLYSHFTEKQKLVFFGVIILNIVCSIFELFTIALVFPVITVLFNPNSLGKFEIVKNIDFVSTFSLTELIDFVFCSFVLFALLSMFVRIFSIYISAKFAFRTGHIFSVKAYKSMLNKPYEHFALENSSEAITNIVAKVNAVIQNFIFPLTMLIGSIIMLSISSVVFVFAATSSKFVLILLFLIILVYSLIIFSLNSKLRENSKVVSSHQTIQTKITQESIGGIKDIILTNSYKVYENEFRKIDMNLRDKQASTILIGQSPRYLVETLGILMILFLAYFMLYIEKSINADLLLPIFATIAIALQRLLPYINQAYRSWVNISSNIHNLNDVLEMIGTKNYFENSHLEFKLPIEFKNSILINDVSFSYKNTSQVLSNITLNVLKGDRIGLIGTTGSGKSTLVDIVIGLLRPSNGYIKVDDVFLEDKNMESWHKLVSYVPQNIHLLDGNIYENICFGVDLDNIDKDRVRKAANLACLNEVISQKDNNDFESVGEGGAKLSGGQRQRIGIARALYKQTPVIVLDEATSALDTATEEKVMQNIYNLSYNPTVFIVAHRVSTLQKCNKIIELENGRIKRIGTFREIIGKIDE